MSLSDSEDVSDSELLVPNDGSEDHKVTRPSRNKNLPSKLKDTEIVAQECHLDMSRKSMLQLSH